MHALALGYAVTLHYINNGTFHCIFQGSHRHLSLPIWCCLLLIHLSKFSSCITFTLLGYHFTYPHSPVVGAMRSLATSSVATFHATATAIQSVYCCAAALVAKQVSRHDVITKLEVHNILQHHQRRTDMVGRMQNAPKLGDIWTSLCSMDRWTYRQTCSSLYCAQCS